MKYYIQYPDEKKDSIDYDKNLVAEAGMNTVYLKPAMRNLLQGLEVFGLEEFTERFCNPESIIIFSEKGEEWNMESFVDMLYDKYQFVKNDY